MYILSSSPVWSCDAYPFLKDTKRVFKIRFWDYTKELFVDLLIIFTRNGQPGLGGESNVSGWDLARDLAARNVSVVTPDIGRLSSGYKKKKKITKPYGKSCKCREKSNAKPSKATVLLVPRERKKMICKSKKRKKK